MKTNYYYKLGNTARIILAFCIVSMSFFTSCKKDDAKVEQPFFEIEGKPTDLKVSSEAKTQSYTVVSNRPWQVKAESQVDWVKASPSSGEGNGTFTITVNENTTTDARTVNFSFLVDGKKQPELLKVTQEKSTPEITPALTISNLEAGENIDPTAQDVIITVESNIEYTYSSDATWFVFNKKDDNDTGAKLTFKASANEDISERVARVSFKSASNPQLNATLVITQEGDATEVVILNEDFSWLTYGSSIFYTSTDEKRMDLWTAEETAKGWTSTMNPVEPNGDQELVYARPGFVKLGKTNYGGDLISPKLSAVTGTKNLQVTFKAVPYKTFKGTLDDTKLTINIIGPGTISKGEFTIDNWPDYDADPNCTEIWTASGTERSFTITGATAETQIRFLAGAFDLRAPVSPNKNRIFLDDIVVTVKK